MNFDKIFLQVQHKNGKEWQNFNVVNGKKHECLYTENSDSVYKRLSHDLIAHKVNGKRGKITRRQNYNGFITITVYETLFLDENTKSEFRNIYCIEE